ncbi:MAG TPA: TonB-dependent receptor [Pseudomonadales bacterium]|jgi:iron complex outermembrane receptor protein
MPAIFFALAALGLLWMPGTVAVAEVSDQSGIIEEMVVTTARKREEAVEDIPASINVFSEDEIRSAGIETPHDFIALTPNVTLVQTQNAGNSFINIRGVSQARNSEMSAAVLVDDVLMTNPAQFNQQLYDIEQIEVLRGPQGALYGRNAIGGAITIRTKAPTDEFEGIIDVGGDSGPGYKVRGAVSGPISDTLKFRASASYVDTEGYINNKHLDEEADPYEDLSARLRLLYEPTDTFSADLRFYISQMDTQALYFNIAAEADDTSLPVRVNNPGVNERDTWGFSLKLDFETEFGTLTSITAFDDLEELLTGDNFDFLPREESWLNGPFTFGFGPYMKFLTGDDVVDLSQTQYLEVEAWSQEIRFTSPSENRVRWILGGYLIATDRYISTGNQVDRGNGVFDVKKTPRYSVFCYDPEISIYFPAECGNFPDDPSPQIGLLADGQDNFAWALFGEVAADLTDQLELAVSLRYDKDERENTTLTEPLYDPTLILGLVTGDKRKESWDDLQPKVTLRYKPQDNVTLYGGYSRGFRSGGFNQTGVGEAVPEPGVEDLFDEQTADTYEIGLKAILMDGRLSTSMAAYYTNFEGAYFFFYDALTSTQNLGSIDEVTYAGVEVEANAMLTDNFTAYLGFGYVDSEIDEAANTDHEGNQAPLVSEYTLNVGLQYRQPLGAMNGRLELVGRVDYQRIGDTYWEPANITKRSPVDLVDLRLGVEVPGDWALTAWAKNAFDKKYNAEYSPGGFLFKAPPARWGVDFTKRF